MRSENVKSLRFSFSLTSSRSRCTASRTGMTRTSIFFQPSDLHARSRRSPAMSSSSGVTSGGWMSPFSAMSAASSATSP